jgi:hypothetical protein
MLLIFFSFNIVVFHKQMSAEQSQVAAQPTLESENIDVAQTSRIASADAQVAESKQVNDDDDNDDEEEAQDQENEVLEAITPGAALSMGGHHNTVHVHDDEEFNEEENHRKLQQMLNQIGNDEQGLQMLFGGMQFEGEDAAELEDAEDEEEESRAEKTNVDKKQPSFASWMVNKGYDWGGWAINTGARVSWVVASSTILLFLPLLLAQETERSMMQIDAQLQSMQDTQSSSKNAPMSLPQVPGASQ